MKSKITISLSVVVTTFFVGIVHNGFAQSSQNYSTRNVLEYSLSSLHNRAQEVSEHNLWLRAEIDVLEEEKQQLKHNVKLLEQEIAVLTDNTEQAEGSKLSIGIQEIQLAKKNAMRFNREIKELHQQQLALEEELQRKKQKETRLQEQLSVAIETMARKHDGNKGAVKKDNAYSQYLRQKQQLVGLESKVINNIGSIRQEIQMIRSKDSKPIRQYSLLQDQKNSLHNRVRQLEEEISLVRQERDSIRSAIVDIKNSEENRIQELEDKITQMNVRKKELESYFDTIDHKMTKLDMQMDVEEQARQMEDNVLVVKRENTLLMNELEKLKREVHKDSITK